MEEDNIIIVKNLCKSFNGQLVLDNINLNIPRHKTTVLIGRSGDGKSVFLKHLIGLLKPDRGQVLLGGENITAMSEPALNRVRRKFGVLFQDAALFDSMTVARNVAFPLREHSSLRPGEIMEQVRFRLQQVGLSGSEDKMPAELSGGMRKRAGLARALALDPEIMLADEPTTGLDPIMTRAINHLLKETQEKLNLTSVIISHDLEGAFYLAHKLIMINKGRLVAQGTPEEIKNSGNPIVRQFLEARLEGPLEIN
jgi:phospholipid/cholesterol/gamma-HCH transport system ATP-binding protein